MKLWKSGRCKGCKADLVVFRASRRVRCGCGYVVNIKTIDPQPDHGSLSSHRQEKV